MNFAKTCIIISGPTAVGKTSIAIEVAGYFNTEILSADSRQCYKELNIGVARPSEDDLKKIPHHFIASHSIHEEVNVKTFEAYALDKLDQIFSKTDVAVVTGGTGLYLRALTDGIDDIPVVPASIRSQVSDGYKEGGIKWLHEMMALHDPTFLENGEAQNPSRLTRALEVALSTGRSIKAFHEGKKAERPFKIVKTGLHLPRPLLQENINTRVDHMIEQGLVAEVTNLLSNQNLKALSTVGYTEIFEFLTGKVNFKQAITDIKTHTRQYAKRQVTWFNKEPEVRWFDPREGATALIDYSNSVLPKHQS